MTDGTKITLTLEEARELARILESVVVSLHKITSREVGRDHGDDVLRTYLGEDGAWRSLSRARLVLATALDRSLGEQASQDLLADVEYWVDDQ
jgi:hypothetical protein